MRILGQHHGTWALLWVALTTTTALAQPVYDPAYVDTEKDTQAWIFIDDYFVDSPNGVDYDSLAIFTDPPNGSVSYNSAWGLLTYVPDDGYEGFDGFTYTIKDEYGVESDPISVCLYVEPEGSVTNLQPVIVGFWVENGGNGWWGFNGQVLDDQDPYGGTVEFGGVMSGTTTVGFDGYFSLVIQGDPRLFGEVSVRYQDPWSVYSEWGYSWVDPAY